MGSSRIIMKRTGTCRHENPASYMCRLWCHFVLLSCQFSLVVFLIPSSPSIFTACQCARYLDALHGGHGWVTHVALPGSQTPSSKQMQLLNTEKTLKVKNDHRSKFSNLSNWKEETWKKNQGFNGIRTRDLRVTSALLYQLSYEATHWERGQFIEFTSPVRSEMMWSIYEKTLLKWLKTHLFVSFPWLRLGRSAVSVQWWVTLITYPQSQIWKGWLHIKLIVLLSKFLQGHARSCLWGVCIPNIQPTDFKKK